MVKKFNFCNPWTKIKELPHYQIFEEIIKEKTKNDKKLKNHTEQVVKGMQMLFKKDPDIMPADKENKEIIKKIINTVKGENDEQLLYCTALFHDIGKKIIQARHGPEGADIIKDSNFSHREKFFNLGIKSHHEIFFMSDLIRFHDYFGTVQTGESSYLIFLEVLCPISNRSLIFGCEKKFLDYLLLLNVVDIYGTPGTKIKEIYPVLMHDFNVIKKIHKNAWGMGALSTQAIASRRVDELIPELRNDAINHTYERLRRLLRTGLVFLQSDNKRKKMIKDYKEITCKEFKPDVNKYKKLTFDTPNWFMKNGKTNDIAPLIASMSGVDVSKNIYYVFAFTCKIDYLLSFATDFIYELLKNEVDKYKAGQKIKRPHDLRRDIAMSILELINTLIGVYGSFTVNDTRIGIGLERLSQLWGYSHERGKLIKRMTCLEGPFKKAEAYKKIKDAANLWIIRQ